MGPSGGEGILWVLEEGRGGDVDRDATRRPSINRTLRNFRVACQNCVCATVLCTVTMVHSGMNSSYSLTHQLTGSGFYLPSASVSLIFMVLYIFTFFAYILYFAF